MYSLVLSLVELLVLCPLQILQLSYHFFVLFLICIFSQFLFFGSWLHPWPSHIAVLPRRRLPFRSIFSCFVLRNSLFFYLLLVIFHPPFGDGACSNLTFPPFFHRIVASLLCSFLFSTFLKALYVVCRSSQCLECVRGTVVKTSSTSTPHRNRCPSQSSVI